MVKKKTKQPYLYSEQNLNVCQRVEHPVRSVTQPSVTSKSFVEVRVSTCATSHEQQCDSNSEDTRSV